MSERLTANNFLVLWGIVSDYIHDCNKRGRQKSHLKNGRLEPCSDNCEEMSEKHVHGCSDLSKRMSAIKQLAVIVRQWHRNEGVHRLCVAAVHVR